jgi:hypothetical protein
MKSQKALLESNPISSVLRLVGIDRSRMPLDELGDRLGDDIENEDAMCSEEVKVWVKMMWESRVHAGLQDTTFEDTFDNQSI